MVAMHMLSSYLEVRVVPIGYEKYISKCIILDEL